MGKKNGKYLKGSSQKRGNRKLGAALLLAVLLLVLAVVAVLLGSNWDAIMDSGSTEPQKQTESQATEMHENDQNETQTPSGEEESIATVPMESQSEPTVSNATVVDAYIKEIDGELHLIKVLSDGTEIDAGPVDNSGEDENTVTYTVTFKNYDGSVLKTETVKGGGNATPPAVPSRKGYTFIGWNGSYSNVNGDITVVAQYQEDEPKAVYYVVKFVDYNGIELKTQSVEAGQAATAPADPIREGYKFVGWDKKFDKVTSNLTVTAQYEEIPTEDLTITVGNKTVAAGEKVTIAVSIKNNPGIVGMTLKLNYDENAMTLVDISQGTALKEMTFTKSKNLASGCQLLWDAEFVDPEDASNGEFLMLTFAVSNTAAAGNYSVTLTAVGDIIDNDLIPVKTVIKNGTITIH